MEIQKDITIRTKCLIVLAVMLLSAMTSGWVLGRKAMDAHECLVSVTAREMIENDDYVVPVYNGQTRLEKTPLNYWLVIFASKLTGRIDEFTARLPSVILAMLSTAAILYFVTQFLSFRIAVMSALMWSTSLAFIRYGHSARPEMSLTSFVTIAMLSFYAGLNADTRKRQVVYLLIFYISFALAMLAKGPAPLPLICAPIFFYILIFKKWRTIPKLLPIIGTIVFLAIVLPWLILLAMRLHPAVADTADPDAVSFWKREFIDRFMGTHRSGGKPFYYYLYVMFQHIVPWVAFIPMALVAPFYKVWSNKRQAMFFLWLWFVVDLVFMSVSGGKRIHYILPAMPAITILAGIIFEDLVFVQHAYTKKFAANFFQYHVIMVLFGAIGAAAYIAGKRTEILPMIITLAQIITLMVITMAFASATVLLFMKNKRNTACVTIFAGIGLLTMLGYSLLSEQSLLSYSRKFAREVADTIPAGDKLIAYPEVSSRVVHYYGKSIPEEKDVQDILKQYQQGAWIIAITESVDQLINDHKLNAIKTWDRAEYKDNTLVPGAIFHKPPTTDQ